MVPGSKFPCLALNIKKEINAKKIKMLTCLAGPRNVMNWTVFPNAYIYSRKILNMFETINFFFSIKRILSS